MMESEWGPWIEHDGRGCPCIGQYVQNTKLAKHCPFSNGEMSITTEGIAGQCKGNWDWSKWGLPVGDGTVHSKVIRYRIRKPKGLAILNAILREVERQPETV